MKRETQGQFLPIFTKQLRAAAPMGVKVDNKHDKHDKSGRKAGDNQDFK